MTQLSLITVDEPSQPSGIDLRCCSVEELLGDMPGEPALIVADPPWGYSQAPGVASPDLQYSTVTDAQIARWIDAAWDTSPNARLALWCTWPKLGEWWAAAQAQGLRWEYTSGGSWHKAGSPGVGHHWRGHSEIVLMYTKGTPPTAPSMLRNAHTSQRQRHSEKPVGWMAEWLERWTSPGDLVLDLFAGLGPMARACARSGRRYVGAELDPERYRQAVDRLALDRSTQPKTVQRTAEERIQEVIRDSQPHVYRQQYHGRHEQDRADAVDWLHKWVGQTHAGVTDE